MSNNPRQEQEVPECQAKFEQELGWGLDLGKTIEGDYKNSATHYCWQGWQAAWSARTLPVEALQEAARSLRREAIQAERDEHYLLGATLHTHASALTALLEQSHE